MNKGETITKEYFDEHTKQFATKKDIEAYKTSSEELLKSLLADSKQHAEDLKSYFSDSLMGIGEYVKSVDDKVTKLDSDMESVKSDISLIRNVLEEKAGKKEVSDLRKRVVNLETRFA